jgi:CheY-like chemotaxis protein
MTIEKVDRHDVFIPTDLGNEELKGSTRLTRTQLELLVKLDGKATLAEIITNSAGRPYQDILRDAQQLADAGQIEMARPGMDVDIDFSYFFGDQPPAKPSDEAIRKADAEAQSGAASLSIDGYYVSIARRAAERRAPAAGGKYAVLAIEDDPNLQRLLTFLLRQQDFGVFVAGNRDEILAALRRLPSADMILLDVILPDANGFDILSRIRQHPVLKSIPVVMLTGKATREDVLRGLAGGADGYITKPFDPEKLIEGVRAVLGLR